jgi:DNA-directed RNA polymerase subunit RPC12/RpoP
MWKTLENLNMSDYDRSPRSLWGGNKPYECLRCGETTMGDNIEERNGEIKCIVCGYRVLKKTKPPVVKRVPVV